MTFSRRQIYRDREQINDCQRLGVAKGLSVRGRMRSFWGVKKLFCVLVMMIGIQTYTCNKVHKTAFIRKRQ